MRELGVPLQGGTQVLDLILGAEQDSTAESHWLTDESKLACIEVHASRATAALQQQAAPALGIFLTGGPHVSTRMMTVSAARSRRHHPRTVL